MKVDLVYKIGSKCDWSNYEELRYSIRSAMENFEDLGKIYIIGNSPEWIDKNHVIYIPCEDPYKRNKDANLINKLILACSNERLSNSFVNMSDDMFFLKKTTLNDLKTPLIDNTHLNFDKPVLNKWQTRLKRTVEVLKNKGFSNINCFEAHTPYLLDKKKYVETLLQFDYGNDLGYCGNTLYFNSINQLNYKQSTQQDLLRLVDKQPLCNLLNSKSRFMNITNKGLSEEVKQFLKIKFPNKTIFESR